MTALCQNVTTLGRPVRKSPWVSIKDRMPHPFSLVTIRNAQGDFQPAWWTGHSWDAHKFRIAAPFAEWKPVASMDKSEEV